MNAARLSKRALAMFTISDNLLNGESLSVKKSVRRVLMI